jgi:hypothetical protein
MAEDLLACLLRMMMAVRDHRGAAVGPVTLGDFVTCLRLAPFPSELRVEHASWLSPLEFPVLKAPSREQFLDRDFCSGKRKPDFALVHRVAEARALSPGRAAREGAAEFPLDGTFVLDVCSLHFCQSRSIVWVLYRPCGGNPIPEAYSR